jgi:hypothetical protein
MLVRLLVVVLTIAGAVPVRLCTCGAAHHHHAQPPPPCDSHHHHHDGDFPALACDPAHEHHDADCHAVKPRPLMSLGLQFDLTNVPPADSHSVALELPPEIGPTSGHALRDFHPPPDRPLFLVYSVLLN